MKDNINHSEKRKSGIKHQLLLILICPLILIILYQIIITPPDLSQCNRITIRYYPSAYVYFFLQNSPMVDVLSTEDREYLNTIDLIEVTNQKQINTFVHSISFKKYKGLYGHKESNRSLYIDCYKNTRRLTSFEINNHDIFNRYGINFELYPDVLESIRSTLHPSLAIKLQYRGLCAYHLAILSDVLEQKDASVNSDPNQWCDLMLTGNKPNYISNSDILKNLICPAVSEDKCHYAMNPNCGPNSPGDMVLLFETKAGWNQHGGEELFTFDNHDPRGGCVLLNDGIVKFIRTKEELNNLRWK